MSKELPRRATPVIGADLAVAECAAPQVRTAQVHVTAERLAHADKVFIEGLEVFANHGVFAEETKLGQKFVITATLFCDTRRAGATDDLDAAIDYGSVAHDIDAYLRDNTFKLIEAAAEAAAEYLLGRYPLMLGIRLRIDKPWAPVGLPLKSCGVEIVRTRG